MNADEVLKRIGYVAVVGGGLVLLAAMVLAGQRLLTSGELVGVAIGAGLSIWIGFSLLDG